jgi:hypothetical protein
MILEALDEAGRIMPGILDLGDERTNIRVMERNDFAVRRIYLYKGTAKKSGT